MLPFVRMLEYGNEIPKPGTRYKIYSSSYGLYLHDTSTKKLYSTGYTAQDTGTGVSSNKFILSASNVKRVLLEDNSSDMQMYEDTSGKVFCTGSSTKAITASTSSYERWTDITSLFTNSGIDVQDIKYMSSYFNSKVNLVLKNGDLYCCGKNDTGTASSFGNGNNIDSPNKFIKIPSISTAKKAMGNLYLTDSGELYGTGINDKYQLGTGGTVSSTTMILMDTGVQEIQSSYVSNMYLKGNGDLYACGTILDARFGNEFGLGSTTVVQSRRIIQRGVSEVISIVDGIGTHIVQNSILYGTGYNDRGRLGVGSGTNISTFTKCQGIGIIEPNTQICRWNAGTLILTPEDKLYYTGWSNLVLGGGSDALSFVEVPMNFIEK